MELTGRELRDIYEAIVKPMPHPDRVGYITRALLLSGGDPDYISLDGDVGFMPVAPLDAEEAVGTKNVSSLNDNIASTMAMDAMYFDKVGTIDGMIRLFHFGEIDEGSAEQNDFIDAVNDGRSKTLDIMYPRFATVKDVIRMVKAAVNSYNMTDDEKEFFNLLLKGGLNV